MMKEDTSNTTMQEQRERLSALADGELQGDAFAEVMLYAATDEGQRQWQVYHVIGEVLRSSEPVALGTPWLLPRLRQQLAKEPQPPVLESVISKTEMPTEPLPAANASVLRWKATAGCASLAAAVALGWNLHSGMITAHVAQAPVPAPATLAASNTGVQQSSSPATVSRQHAQHTGDAQVMLRDPRLDELLAAHQQLGNTTALQMPAGFLRNATFETHKR